jgi:hypothetical protein
MFAPIRRTVHLEPNSPLLSLSFLGNTYLARSFGDSLISLIHFFYGVSVATGVLKIPLVFVLAFEMLHFRLHPASSFYVCVYERFLSVVPHLNRLLSLIRSISWLCLYCDDLVLVWVLYSLFCT